MVGVESDIASSALRLWLAATSAAMLVAFLAVAFFLPRTRTVAAFRASLVLLGAILGAAMTWAFVGGVASGDHGAERIALKMRAAELAAQSLAPGSPLACLDGLAGEGIEAACERAIFASPGSVATAMSYVAARISLLADAAAYAGRGAPLEDVVLPLRRSLESDRFGFVAHVLATRNGCTSQTCKPLALLHDSRRVRANLSARPLDGYLEHYLAVWDKAPDTSLAEATPPQSGQLAQAGANGAPHKINIDFPTAASIPPVSIMNPEPSGPVLPGVAAAAAANPNPHATPAPAASRHPHKQAVGPASQPTPQAAAMAGAASVEPIWPEPLPRAPAAFPQASAAPAGAGPVQLIPFPLPPQANASAPARAQ